MNQVLFIHGGTSFNSYERYLKNLKESRIEYERLIYDDKSWKDWLAKELKKNNIDFLSPSFPNKQNANYQEWTIYFEKIIPFLRSDAVLIGYSLGATFLAKYFSENSTAGEFKDLILLAPAYNDETNEDLGSFKISNSKNLSTKFNKISIFHSKDDPIVDFKESIKFINDNPTIELQTFENYSHFFIDDFPELLEYIINR